MQSIINFFGANGFIPHGYCLTWSSGLLWLHVLSDALIVLAYYSIPLTLVYFVRQRKDLPYPWLFTMFGLFIVACGTTHLLSIITVWIPLYWLDGIVKAITAAISVVAALMMFWVIPRALLLRSPAQLEVEVKERKRAEAALQQNQKELQDAQRIAHVGNWRLDVATNHVVWSEELYRIWGLSQDLPPPDYHEHHKFLTPESWERLDAILPHTRETGIPYEVELEIVRVDGSHGWILARGEAIRDASGAIITLQGVAMDITERKQAEDALRESEANLYAMLDNFPYLTWLKDSRGRYIKINKVFADYLHLENPQQAIGKTDLDLQPKELAEKYRADDVEVMASRKSKHVEETAFDGKNTHWVETYKTPIIDSHGNVLGTAGFAGDITDRKQAELKLEISETRYRTLFEQTADYVLVLEPSNVGPPIIIDANDAAFIKHGYSRSELIGKPITFLDCEAAGKAMPEWVRLLQSSKPVHFEAEHACKDGSTFWADVAVRRVTIGGKDLFYSIERDATARKKAEYALDESMHMLKEKELAKTRFFAAAGHDLRQPLAAANLFIDTLKSTESTPQQNKIIQRLDQAMTTFKGLLDSLLNISKLDSGIVKPEYTLVKVAEVFNLLEQNFAPMASEKQIGFKLYFPMRETLVVCSDIGLLNSVLINLVSNAIKFTSKGAILISARKRGGDVLFQVWDTGIGIADEHIEHIFDEFYQINNLQRDRASGIGLGLSIIKRILVLLDTKITCRSQIGRGSVFEFRLPSVGISSEGIQQAVTVAPQGDVINLSSFVQGKLFIVLEDDILVAQALIHSLEGLGGEVKCFHSAEDALRHANTEFADFYIVDYMLGGTFNGLQFLSLLHQKLGKPINAVLVTGDTSTNFIQEAVNCDWPVLYKPVNIFKLISSFKA